MQTVSAVPAVGKTFLPGSAVAWVGRYAYVSVDALMLGHVLVTLGCTRAIELDINGTWPPFLTFATTTAGTRTGVFLDRRIGGSTNRYLTGSTKEFFAMFDTSTTTNATILDPS